MIEKKLNNTYYTTNPYYMLLDIHGNEFYYRKIKHVQYNYELLRDYIVDVGIQPHTNILGKFYYLDYKGVLTIRTGYKWDGVSGPMIDTDNTMIAGAIHDVGYRMIRRGELNIEYKSEWDSIFKKVLLENGKPVTIFGQWWNILRANYAYAGVHFFGGSSCIPNSQKG